MKTLIVGWFSFEQCGVTAGDVMARDIVCEWLESIDCAYDVALAHPFSGGINWRLADPNSYSHVVFVCGPFPYIKETVEFVRHFSSCCLIGLDLSMLDPLDVWNPFDVLLERDSSVNSRPDITFLSHQKQIPVVGIILVEPQPEYKDKGKYQVVKDAINRLRVSQEMVVVTIDTCLDPNTTNLRSAVEVESLIARMDLVITTRLHGTVLALKNQVPVIAIDPIAGGAKVLHQAKCIGWSTILTIDTLTDTALQAAFNYCKTEAARVEARECRELAIKAVKEVRDEFLSAITVSKSSNSRREFSDEKYAQLLVVPKQKVDLKNEILHILGRRITGLGRRIINLGERLL